MEDQQLRDRVGRRIRAEREAGGYRLADIADAIGMSESNLSRIESGKRTVDITTLLRIGEVLGVRPDVFLDEERDEVIAYARTDDGGRDDVTAWTLDLFADIDFVEAEKRRHGWG
jgi:transcriptional regulator with XRE-family HTH domain